MKNIAVIGAGISGLASLVRTTSLSMYHAENFGTHYARTLHAWRVRFHQRLPANSRHEHDDGF
jgi:cyclopropane fatty-acyl-phospholipid synthase-like methyltransferase